MKTIGLIGGMSWESSVLYYQLINKKVNEVLGGLHSCKSLMYTVDFEEVAQFQRNGDWQSLAEMMSHTANLLQNAGADMILICANTMHKVADEVADSINIPVIHIGDATAESITKAGLKKVGLLGTKYTMEQDFLKNRITGKGIEIIVPDEADRDIIHNVIYQELAKGVIDPESRKAYLAIMDKLVAQGAEGIILGCTEIGLLIKQSDTNIPVFDTTVIHAYKAVEIALAN